MARTGANPDELDALARSFEQVGTGLRDGGAAVRSLVDTGWWQGPDAQRFRSGFADQHGQLTRVAESLGALAGTLRREAEQQRTASGARAGRSPVGPGAGGSTAGRAATTDVVRALGLDPRWTTTESAVPAALLRCMGFGSSAGHTSIDPEAARRWLTDGPDTSSRPGAAVEQPTFGTLPATLRASTLLGTTGGTDAWSGWQGQHFAKGFSRSFEIGFGRQAETSGQLGFASYDARLRALIGAEGAASGRFSIGADGLSTAGEAWAFVGARADGAAGVGVGGLDASVAGEAAAGAGAGASGAVDLSWDRIAASGGVDAFAGAEASYSGSVGGYGAAARVGGGVRAGVGFEADADVDFGIDRIGFDVDLGAGLGIGGDFKLGVGFSPKGAYHGVADFGDAAASGLVDAAEDVGSALKGAGKSIGKALKPW